MASRKKALTPEMVKMKELSDVACEELDKEMMELGMNNASLITHWIFWEMSQTERPFEDVAVSLCRDFLHTHMTKLMIAQGHRIQEAEDAEDQDAAV